MNRYNALITAVANSPNGTLARALEVLIQMKSHRNRLKRSDGRLSGSSEAVLSLEPDIVTINSLLTVCEKDGAWETALEILEDLKEGSARDPNMRGHMHDGRRSKYPGVPSGPDLISYNAAIASCRKDGQWECAMNLLDDMRSSSTVEPDLISFNSALGVCVKARNPGAGRAALEIWRRITVAGSGGVPPGSTNGLHRRKASKKGTSLEPDDITFDTMVDALENDSTEGCCKLADHFFSLGIRRGQYKDVYTGVDCGRNLGKAVAKSEEEEEEEEVGTLEGTLTASTSAAQLQALKGTRCHVLDLHGCSQVRAQVAVRNVLKRFARGLITKEENTHSEAPDSPTTIAALEMGQLTLPLSSHDIGNDDKHMDKNQDEDDAIELKYDLVVITGKGLHSEDAPVLVSETRAYLSDPDKFDPPLEIREVKGNSGRFVIPMSSIKAWALAVPRKPD